MSKELPPALAAALEELVESFARRIVELERESLLQRSEMTAEPSPWMGIEQAAAYLDWPKGRLYKLTAAGAIPHYKHEGRLLFHREELDRWLGPFAEGERR